MLVCMFYESHLAFGACTSENNRFTDLNSSTKLAPSWSQIASNVVLKLKMVTHISQWNEKKAKLCPKAIFSDNQTRELILLIIFLANKVSMIITIK